MSTPKNRPLRLKSLADQITLKAAFKVILLGLLCSYLYDRCRVMTIFYTNAPNRLVRVNELGNYTIKFSDKLKSCEDFVLIEDCSLAILACDPGRERWNTALGLFLPGPVAEATLWAYNYSHGVPDSDALVPIELKGFPEGQDLHTLGIAYHKEESTLIVTNHAKEGSRIEIFDLDLDTLTARHKRTIQHPLLHGPNAIEIVNKNEFYVTNDHYILARKSAMFSNLESYLGIPGGTVVHVSLHGSAVTVKVVARVPFANGIAMLNSSAVAVASTTRRAIIFYKKLDGGDLGYQGIVNVPFMPDNIKFATGKLLAAGHAHPPTTIKFSETRHICNDPRELARAGKKMKIYCANAVATSWVSEWSEDVGLKHIYVDTDYPTSASAARDTKRGVVIITGLYAKGILVWKDEAE